MKVNCLTLAFKAKILVSAFYMVADRPKLHQKDYLMSALAAKADISHEPKSNSF